MSTLNLNAIAMLVIGPLALLVMVSLSPSFGGQANRLVAATAAAYATRPESKVTVVDPTAMELQNISKTPPARSTTYPRNDGVRY